MPRLADKLTDAQIRRAATPGKLRDGSGLYLAIKPRRDKSFSKSWVVCFPAGGKSREMGLGPYPEVTLAEARTKAADARRKARDGADPLEARKAADAEAEREKAQALSFRDAAAIYIATNEKHWKNPKHRQQWRNTLSTYAYPVIGDIACPDITNAHMVQILEPIWKALPETASRVRGRCENIIDWSAVNGHRDPNQKNPAAWKGNLKHVLGKQGAEVEHQPALPFEDVPAFFLELGKRDEIAARALEMTILNVVRTSNQIGARWIDHNIEQAEWAISAADMKMPKGHRVPLATQTVTILRELEKRREKRHPYVLPGLKALKPLSNMAMLELRKRMNRPDITVHGFRSTFQDWASETTDYHPNLIEMALAHVIKDKTEKAYRRGDLFEKRRPLMQAWADYCFSKR